MRLHWLRLSVVLCSSFALSATSVEAVLASQDSIHWHNDLESAKTVAKESGRLVLVHFWAPTCGPCMALESNVFNQPGVANAIETQFVPVKLNADENSATAQWFGVTRIPCDVIVTPEGQMVCKLISPPTPAAYVAELTSAAGKYTAKGGQAYARAAAGAPVQPQLNSAYANLQVSQGSPLVMAPTQDMHGSANPVAAPSASAQIVQNPLAQGKQHKSGAATETVPVAPTAPMPQVVNNPAANVAIKASPAPAAPTTAAVAAGSNQVTNPYVSATTSSPPPISQAPVNPLISPAQTPAAYANATLPIGSAPTAFGPPPASTPAMTVATAPSVPDAGKLPPGAPPLGFDGYCPVSMRNSWKWVSGDPRFGVVHRGRTYWFAGSEEQKQFWADPDRYTPALSGMDPVLAIDHQQQVPGKREHSLDYDGLFYMFASEATLQQFTANPQHYSTGVRQAMGIPRGRLVR